LLLVQIEERISVAQLSATAAQQVDDDHDEGDDQYQVDEASADVESEAE
jgi:hypothetical protein